MAFTVRGQESVIQKYVKGHSEPANWETNVIMVCKLEKGIEAEWLPSFASVNRSQDLLGNTP